MAISPPYVFTNGFWRVRGTVTPANFNGFRVLAALLHRCRSTEGNQTLHDKFGRLLLYIHFGGSCLRNGILPKFTLRPSLAFSYIGSVTARDSSSLATEVCGVVQGMKLRNFHRERHLCSAGRPSRWGSAHIIVKSFFTRTSTH